MCLYFYAGHFDIYNKGYLFDSTSTHVILTHVISYFWWVFHSKPYSPPRRHWYQKMWNFIAHLLIHNRNLSHHFSLLKHPRKSAKMDFRCSVPRKLVRDLYHLKWFLKLYNLSYSDESFKDWVQKSLNSRISTFLWPITRTPNTVITAFS